MRWGSAFIVLCTLLATAVAAPTVFADEPPPAPPIPAPPMDDITSMLPDPPAFDEPPTPMDEMPMPDDPPMPDEVIEEEIIIEEAPPAPIEYYTDTAPIVAQPAPLSQGDCRPACAQRRDACCWPLDWCGNRYGCWEITLEGGSTFFDEAPDGPFGLPDYGTPDQIEWEVLDYGTFFEEFGGRATIRYAVNPGEWIEARGTYYGEWSNEAVDAGTFAFEPGPLGIGGAIDPNVATLFAESKVYGGELNYWTEIACEGCTRWDAGLGIHYVRFDEIVMATDWLAPFPGFNEPAFAQSDVKNIFFGLQLMGAVHRDLSDRVTLTGSLKGMIGNVNREIKINDRSFFAGGPHAATSEDDEIVFGADIDISLLWRLTPRIGVTLGYNFFFLDGVVRANDAIDFTHSVSGALQAQQVTDQIVMHTIYVGLNLNF